MYPPLPPYDPPTAYPPPPPPPPQRRTLWRWYRSRGCFVQGLLGCVTLGFIGFCTLLCIVGTPAFVTGWHNGQATDTAVARGVTAAPTPTASTQPTGARMGGSLDDFVARYGQPTKTAPDNETFTDGTVAQITAYVNKSLAVDRIFLTGKKTWTQVDAYTYCLQFLPSNAQEYNRITGTIAWIDYHSSMGEIVMQVQAPTCLLFMSS